MLAKDVQPSHEFYHDGERYTRIKTDGVSPQISCIHKVPRGMIAVLRHSDGLVGHMTEDSEVECISKRPVKQAEHHEDFRVDVKKPDADVMIFLPNGQHALVQYRSEHQTIDLCLSHQRIAYVHPDDDLGEPQASDKDPGNAWKAKQIVLT